MKTKKTVALVNMSILAILILVITLFLTSCTKKIAFTNSSVVPAARGYITVKKDNNKNNVITVKIDNLAEINRIQPASKAYVVWMVTDEGVSKNIGQVKSGSGTFSKKLKASLVTVSTFKPVKVFVTAEESAEVLNPGSIVVLTTEKF